MKVIVAVKRVIDHNVKVRVKADNSGVETVNVKMSMNPFDEIAVEEAIRLKESAGVSEVVIVSIGNKQSQETIRTALAMGSDRGILVETDQELQPLAIAKLLQCIVEKESAKLIILGKQSVDMDNGQTGQMLAALLGWGQATFASKVELHEDSVDVTREVDSGLQSLKIALPAIITADLRLNDPRYASLPNIMKARRKPLEVITPTELNIDVTPSLKILKVCAPERRTQGIKVATVTELVDKLKNEAKVI